MRQFSKLAVSFNTSHSQEHELQKISQNSVERKSTNSSSKKCNSLDQRPPDKYPGDLHASETENLEQSLAGSIKDVGVVLLGLLVFYIAQVDRVFP